MPSKEQLLVQEFFLAGLMSAGLPLAGSQQEDPLCCNTEQYPCGATLRI